jgi:DNA-binding GntR family transcriptional regulator
VAETPARRQVASQRIADILAERILSGRLAPGARIIQDELAEELNASRLPVREALRILESRGLVTLKANVGASVTEMTMHDLRLSYEIRERVEPLLLAESAPALSEADLDEMARVQDEIEAEAEDEVDRFLALDREFHWISYRRHDAPHLAAIIARLWDTTQHYRRAYVALPDARRSWVINAEHRLLLESLSGSEVF